MNDLHHLSGLELHQLFLRGAVSAVEMVRFFLKRIEQYDRDLGAFLSHLGERALLRAEALDRKRAHQETLGKLAGIPIALKDIMHVHGEITTCASKLLKNYRAPFDATVVRLLESEDALLIGKTNLDEFAMGSSNEHSAYFPAKNPWNVECVPGGSSGGSATAVAARLAPIATGSDTGGSIRQPAAFCGIVGFKPTYGRVSRYGLVAFASSLDQIGPMTTTVSDAGLMMEVIGRHCSCDSTSLPLPPESYLDAFHPDLKNLTFGVPYKLLEGLAPEIQDNFSQSLQIVKELGAEIIEIDLDACKYGISVYYILAPAEASTNLARFDGIRYGVRAHANSLDELYDLTRAEGFGREVKQRILLGTYVLSAGYQDAFYKKAQKVRTVIINEFERAFSLCDGVLLPTSPSAAFPLNSIHDPIKLYLQDMFTILANLAALPAVSVPSGFTQKGLPLGIQIIGPQLHDVAVLNYAYAFEQATQHGKKIPSGYA